MTRSTVRHPLAWIVYALVHALSPAFPLVDGSRRSSDEDAERFIEEARGDDSSSRASRKSRRAFLPLREVVNLKDLRLSGELDPDVLQYRHQLLAKRLHLLP